MIIRHGNPNNSFSESTDTFVVIIEAGGENTLRPADPLMMELWRQRRQQEAEQRKLLEDHCKSTGQLPDKVKDEENPSWEGVE
jgi:hypothetical protein